MAKKQKGLQKFTINKKKVDKLLALEKITPKDLEDLNFNRNDVAVFGAYIAKMLNELEFKKRDDFFEKVEEVMPEDFKNQLWENNHFTITAAISKLITGNGGTMPTKNQIAVEAKLSRQTVHKHLKEYSKHPQYLELAEQFKFMTTKLLSKTFQRAMDGDVGAAKLYFNVMGCLNGQSGGNTSIQNQNNFIQINGTVLSQEMIKRLSPEQLNVIDSVLKTALPQAT